jgi:hypothetical protein
MGRAHNIGHAPRLGAAQAEARRSVKPAIALSGCLHNFIEDNIMQTRYRTNIGLAVSTVAMIALIGSACSAQGAKHFALKGECELGGSVSFQSYVPVSDGNTGDATMIFSLNPYIGYFVTDGFEIGLNPLGITQSNSYTRLMILVAPAYNFRTQGPAYPFIEALAGYTSQTNGNEWSGFSWGGRGGLKVAVTEKGLLNLSVQYLEITLNTAGATNRSGSNQFSISAGFTVWFDPPSPSPVK